MKVETAAKLEKRHEREAKELNRLKRAKARPAIMHGFWFLLVILTVIYIADEISSNVNGVMKPYMIFDLFRVPNADTKAPEYGSAISVMAIATIPTYILTAINPLYRTLADRFGRKIFLFINTLGMGLGMLICMTAANPYIFVVGTCLTGFFTPNDMQVIYLMETAPIKHRAKLCIPVLIALVISVVAYVFTKETPVFLDRRIAYLEKSDEERAAEAAKGKSENGGLKEAFRYIVHTPQTRTLAILVFIFSIAVAMSGYVSEVLLAGGHMSNDDMNLFYIIEPIVYAVFAFFSGFLTDALGRKNSGFLFGLLAIIGQCVFVFGSKAGIGPVALALANGLMFGGLWSLSDLLFIVLPGESAPTRIRATVMSLISYAYISNLIVTMLVGVFYDKIGSAKIGTFQLFFFVPFILITIAVLKLKVKETKDTDLSAVGEGEN